MIQETIDSISAENERVLADLKEYMDNANLKKADIKLDKSGKIDQIVFPSGLMQQ